jgi:hypothetical protein
LKHSRLRSTALVLGSLLVCLPLTAVVHAQDGTTGTTTTTTTTPTTDPQVLAEARERFARGLTLAHNGDCSAAIAEFDASLRLVERPSTLYNLAHCEEDLHRYDLAVQQYERYLTIASADAEDRPTVEATLANLRALLGTIHVSVNAESAEVWLGDRVVGHAPGDVLVPGGRHAIEVRATGYLPTRREVEVAAHETVQVDITLEQAEQHITQQIEQHIEQHEHITQQIEETHVHVERPPLPSAVFWTGLGLTAATGIMGMAAGINALITHDHLATMDARLPRDTSGVRDSALVADIGFIACGVFAVSTFIVAFLTDWEGAPPQDERHETTTRQTVRVMPTGNGLRVEF